MLKKLNSREQEILKIILNFLENIEKDNSILKGDLLKEEEKSFIINNLNAFIIGLIADQSVKAEVAWSLPYKLFKRIGTFDFKVILSKYDENALENILKIKPSLHRYPAKMAHYIYSAIEIIVTKYNSKVENIWENKSANEIVRLFEEFKGISHKKASLGVLMLVRDLGINVLDKENIDITYDVHIRRIFLRLGLVSQDSQELILATAKKIYPPFPGRLTTPFWVIGRNFCHLTNPDCVNCPLYKYCEKNLEKSQNIK